MEQEPEKKAWKAVKNQGRSKDSGKSRNLWKDKNRPKLNRRILRVGDKCMGKSSIEEGKQNDKKAKKKKYKKIK